MLLSAYPIGTVPLGGFLAIDDHAIVLPYLDALEAPSVELIFVVELDLVVATGPGAIPRTTTTGDELLINDNDKLLIDDIDILEIN